MNEWRFERELRTLVRGQIRDFPVYRLAVSTLVGFSALSYIPLVGKKILVAETNPDKVVVAVSNASWSARKRRPSEALGCQLKHKYFNYSSILFVEIMSRANTLEGEF